MCLHFPLIFCMKYILDRWILFTQLNVDLTIINFVDNHIPTEEATHLDYTGNYIYNFFLFLIDVVKVKMNRLCKEKYLLSIYYNYFSLC
jgi:hypothetical protein